MNPCTCSPPQIPNYITRVSGPLMDRIDIRIEAPAVPFKELSANAAGLLLSRLPRAGAGRASGPG